MESRRKAIVAYVEVPYGGTDINSNADFVFILIFIFSLESIKNGK